MNKKIQKIKFVLFVISGVLIIAIGIVIGMYFYNNLFSGTTETAVITINEDDETEEIIIEVDMDLHNATTARLMLEANEGEISLDDIDNLDAMTSLELIRAAYGEEIASAWEDMIKYPNSSVSEFPMDDISSLLSRWYESFVAQNYELIVSEMNNYMELYSFTSVEHSEITSLYHDALLMVNYNASPSMSTFVNIASEFKNAKCLIIVCLQYDIDLTSMVVYDSNAALRGTTITFNTVSNYSYGTDEYELYSNKGVLAESFDIYEMTIDEKDYVAVIGHMNDELIMVGFYLSDE